MLRFVFIFNVFKYTDHFFNYNLLLILNKSCLVIINKFQNLTFFMKAGFHASIIH